MTIVAAAGGGDWNTGSSWVGGVAPTAADDVQVPLAAGNMSIGSGAVCRSADFSTYTGTLSGTGTLTIGDGTAGLSNIALTLVAGMTVTGPPAFSFVSTSATQQTINFASKTTGALTFNATSNGSWIFTGGNTSGGAVTLTKGTLNINGQTVSWNTFSSNNSNTRTLTLGAAQITITGTTANTWDLNGSNFTLTANTADLTFTGAGSQISSNNSTFNSITMNASGTFTLIRPISVTNFTRVGTAVKTDGFSISTSVTSSLTVTGTLTLTGNSKTNRLLVQSSSIGTARTITAATVTVNACDFQDITGAGAGSWDLSGVSNYSGDCGGNTNITFTTPSTETATGTSSFTWSTHGWTSRVPLPQDTVSIPNAFSASQTITADMPRLGGNIVFSCSGSPVFAPSTTISIFGSLNLTGVGSTSSTNTVTLSGRGSYNITSAGVTITQSIVLNAPTGTYTLLDSFTSNRSASGAITITNGTFTDGGFDINLTGTSSTFAMTAGTVNLTGTLSSGATSGSFINITGGTVNASTSTIVLSSTSATTRTFVGGGKTFGTLTYIVPGSTGELDITGSNSFAAINFSDVTNARSLKFTAGTTTTIRNMRGFNVNGTAGKLMIITSITGAAFTMTSPALQSFNYVNPTNMVVDATPKWYAGINSTDGGGNTNLVFTAAPATGSNFAMMGI